MYTYNKKYYYDGELHQLRPKMAAIHTYQLTDGTIIAMFQGNRGAHPDLDFKIKLLRVGEDETPFPPPHLFWVADLLIKSQRFPNEIKEIVEYYISFYENCVPFNTVEERQNYTPRTKNEMMSRYGYVQVEKTLPIDYIALVIELFCYCEKRNEGAEMFKNILIKFKAYIEGEIDYMHLLTALDNRMYR